MLFDEELVLKKLIDSDETTEQVKQLIIHNDDINSFDWVIDSLVDVCNLSSIQAEQCTIIAHFKGNACAKSGELTKLKPMRNGLADRGINATIE